MWIGNSCRFGGKATVSISPSLQQGWRTSGPPASPAARNRSAFSPRVRRKPATAPLSLPELSGSPRPLRFLSPSSPEARNGSGYSPGAPAKPATAPLTFPELPRSPRRLGLLSPSSREGRDRSAYSPRTSPEARNGSGYSPGALPELQNCSGYSPGAEARKRILPFGIAPAGPVVVYVAP